jgi:hypothetical protein
MAAGSRTVAAAAEPHLVRRDEAQDEGVDHRGEDLLLVDDVALLLRRHHLVLAHRLERVRRAGRLVEDEADAAERADAEELLRLQVLPVGRRLLRLHLRLLAPRRLDRQDLLQRAEQLLERGAAEPVALERLGAVGRHHGRHRRLRGEQRTLAEKVAGAEGGDRIARAPLEDGGAPALDDVEVILRRVLLDHLRPRRVRHLLEAAEQQPLLVGRQRREDRLAVDLGALEHGPLEVVRHRLLQVAHVLKEGLARQREQRGRADGDGVRLPRRRLRLEARLAEHLADAELVVRELRGRACVLELRRIAPNCAPGRRRARPSRSRRARRPRWTAAPGGRRRRRT